MTGESRVFGVLSDGREVTEYTLRNDTGVVVRILNYGGIIRVLECPDRDGQVADIVLGFDTLEEYEARRYYFGAVVGRVAGRIAGGRLPINGEVYQLPVNNRPNHLHGGEVGFDRRLWGAEFSVSDGSLTLSYQSPAGEEGYPGRLLTRVTYRLTESGDLTVDYSATTDKTTAVNLTQHSYFNLSGDPAKGILDHILTVPCDKVLELDEHAIPTGVALDVSGSSLDFLAPRKIGGKTDVAGLDGFWVLPEESDARSMRSVAELWHEATGRLLQVATTAPGVQIYSGDQLPASLIGKQGIRNGSCAGVCFETQAHPDSPNHRAFPEIFLEPGEIYQSSTVFKMRAK